MDRTRTRRLYKIEAVQLRTLICSNIERRDARRTDNVPSNFFLSGPFVNVNPDPTLRQQQLHNFGVATVARCI